MAYLVIAILVLAGIFYAISIFHFLFKHSAQGAKYMALGLMASAVTGLIVCQAESSMTLLFIILLMLVLARAYYWSYRIKTSEEESA